MGEGGLKQTIVLIGCVIMTVTRGGGAKIPNISHMYLNCPIYRDRQKGVAVC